MTFKCINNRNGILDFTNTLDLYEESSVFNEMDFHKKRKAAMILKSALERLVLAFPIDTFRMMAILATRMVKNKNRAYSQTTLISMAEVSHRLGGVPLIMAIPYGLTKILEGQMPEFDQMWFSMTNGNPAIKIFMENYKESTFGKAYLDPDIQDINEIYVLSGFTTNANEVEVLIGADSKAITLDSRTPPLVTFKKDPNTLSNPMINVMVSVGCEIKSFRLHSSIKIENSVKDFLLLMNSRTAAVSQNEHKTLIIPAPFCRYNLYVSSFDNGNTWTVNSFEINYPLV